MQNTFFGWFGIRAAALLQATALLGGCVADKPVSELEQSRTALAARDYANAITAADTYLARSPTGPHAAEAYYLKGRALEDEAAASLGEARSNLQQARTAYIAALKTGITDTGLEGNVRASLADVAYWQDDYATAAEQWIAAYGMLEDRSIKAWSLYRAGVSQQRLGQYDSADKTLQLVVQAHPDTEPGRRAKTRIGVRGFYVQVATFADKRSADSAAQTLVRNANRISQRNTPDGKTVVLVGPFTSYGQASGMRGTLAKQYPDALITP